MDDTSINRTVDNWTIIVIYLCYTRNEYGIEQNRGNYNYDLEKKLYMKKKTLIDEFICFFYHIK